MLQLSALCARRHSAGTSTNVSRVTFETLFKEREINLKNMV
jgi:hypothetical protein